MQGLTENHISWRGLPVKKILFTIIIMDKGKAEEEEQEEEETKTMTTKITKKKKKMN